MAASAAKGHCRTLFHNAALLLERDGRVLTAVLDAVRQPSSREGIVRVCRTRSRLILVSEIRKARRERASDLIGA